VEKLVFQQPLRQIPMSMHCPAHYYIFTGDFIKENMLVERMKNQKETPLPQPRMMETAMWTNLRILFEELNCGFKCLKGSGPQFPDLRE
jgi:hypothetical protein